MIAAALALLLIQAEAPLPPEVVVVAQRMRRFKARTHRDKRTGVTRCAIRRSSGDADMDATLCDAMLACDTASTTFPEAKRCMEARMPAIMARFVPGMPPNAWSIER